MRLMPSSGDVALDIGARDGHFSTLIAERFARVIALDLSKPNVRHPKVECVQGDASSLQFPDKRFDLVFCAEVLEHIPSHLLPKVCGEIGRVSARDIVIGVPYRQDIRVGRTTCFSCGTKNPPWGHVNSFEKEALERSFPQFHVAEVSYVGTSLARTNFVSTLLMDYAGNPYGTYDQEESCLSCGRSLVTPPKRRFDQKVATKLAFWTRQLTERNATPQPSWIHMRLTRRP